MLVEDEKENREEIVDEIKDFIDSVEPTMEFLEKKEKTLGYKKTQ